MSRSPFRCALSASIVGSVSHPAGDRPSHPICEVGISECGFLRIGRDGTTHNDATSPQKNCNAWAKHSTKRNVPLPRRNCSASSQSTILANFGGSLLWFGCEGIINVSTLFELHIISMFVSQRIFNADIAIFSVWSINTDLNLFRLTRM
jgi:hypothetical protein